MKSQINKKYLIKSGTKKILDDVWIFDENYQNKEIIIKAVVEEEGDFQAKGMLKIAKGVKDVDVFLRYKVLLVGKNARAKVDPELEILSNDVKASHAASIGRIDQEQLFYLMSRGLSKKEAEELIIKAFLE